MPPRLPAEFPRYLPGYSFKPAYWATRRRELFRIAVADLLGELDPAEVGYALTDVTAATLEAALSVAVWSMTSTRCHERTQRITTAKGHHGTQNPEPGRPMAMEVLKNSIMRPTPSIIITTIY